MSEHAITIGELVAFGSFLVLIVSAGAGMWWRIHVAIGKVRERVDEVRGRSAHELAEFKLQVAQQYATHDAIREVEERVVEAIDRLGDRVDKFLERSIRSPPKE